MSIFSILFKVKGGIFSIPFNMKVCLFSLESPHRGNSNEYIQHTILM